jgi:hypothetical protein
MASKKNSYKKSVRSSFKNQFLKREVIIAVVFVLIFSSIGGYLIGRSGASGRYCVNNYFSEAADSGSYNPCVLDLQGMNNTVYRDPSFRRSLIYLAQDGYFGPDTNLAQTEFKESYPEARGDGSNVVGPLYWAELCSLVAEIHGTGGDAFNGAGCYTII